MLIKYEKSGFTLVELLGIIIIISLIFLFSFTNLSNTTKKNKENEYEMFVKDLCLSGQNYIYSNLEKYPETSKINSEITINVNDLIIEGLIDKNTLNPKTNTNILNDYMIYTVKSDYTLDCEYRN